ncbi:DUF2892 domain-containing protein [Cytobacillus depressus]|uniref:DUF2892 domain-containing protein n=2 Tax=Cytobacillus depressus TaxID=1602942 RepID=A0A6L3V338_9BACI|nr:DUF2892 domain-containing protein [Cytobacillus depressus]KAB2331213.1 DUF2892 domain-containing protein [Cytobacillus depressus]
MRIKPNIGLLNALIRITVGLTVLACASAKLVKCPWRQSNFLFVVLGSMKVAEGIVRYCPVTALCECGQEKMQEMKEEIVGQSEMSSYNPS